MDGQERMIIELTHGRGLLDARALWASIVGPHRLAMTTKRTVELRVDRAVEIARNIGLADAFVFVGVSLPANAPTIPLLILTGQEETLGESTSGSQVLTNQMGGGAFAPSGFMQLLQPGEQLFAQINDPAVAAGFTQRVVVAAVTF
jgi:hypothetical protein